jgi:hypothetical protein
MINKQKTKKNKMKPMKNILAMGKEMDIMKSFFDNFKFTYLHKHKILTNGNNGIIYELEFEKLKFKAYTIVKRSKKETSDNILYEYIVGVFLNQYHKKTPIFLETFGFIVDSFDFQKSAHLNQIKQFNPQSIKKIISYSCSDPTSIGIEIEYVKKPKTLNDLLNKSEFWKFNVFPILFLIYSTLSYLSNVFTHYDLHLDNILVFEPIPNEYIQYHFYYHDKDIVSFRCKYLIKMIDYGRCYFHNKKTNVNSKMIYEEICRQKECNQKKNHCGDNLGYYFMHDEKKSDEKNYYYINSAINNQSHDLRCLFILQKHIKKKKIKIEDEYPINMNVIIQLLFKNLNYLNEYGTKEIKEKGLPNKINNIVDVCELLKMGIQKNEFQEMNQKHYQEKNKCGDLHVYFDGSNKDMIYHPV